MSMLDLPALRATPLHRDPFDHVLLPSFLRVDEQPRLLRDFPPIDRPGSFPPAALSLGPSMHALLQELESPAVTAAFAEKFAVDLTDRPTFVTLRGHCQDADGEIHTDSATKILTVLIYLNPEWPAAGGRLRLLRSADDLEDHVAEILPVDGALVAFRRGERSWHGHYPYTGERRSIQLNWLTSASVLRRERVRHAVSATAKRLLSFGSAAWR